VNRFCTYQESIYSRGFQDDGNSFWQISDFNPSRSVLDHQRWLGRALKEDETCTITCGVLKALAYLRYRRIVHGNIKPSNIMFNIENGEGILSDFRLPGYQRFDELAKPGSSLYYMAPEVLLSQGKDASEKSDLWSLAATICELMSRFPPYNDMTREEVESEMRKTPFKRPNLPSIALDHCKDFLATCFMVPASKRPTAELLMPHPWVCRGLSSGLSHLELTGTMLSDWQQSTLLGVYAPTETPIPGSYTLYFSTDLL
jgi:serine/threonine protein kinase